MRHLRRYAEIVDDVEAFLAACARPLPRALWVNTLRTDPSCVARWIHARCERAVPLSWADAAWRLPADTSAGKWPEFALGLVHAQEEVALWPVRVLDPQPGEHVLDLCAAPGNKTAQIAVAMGDAGCILANDISASRLDAVQNLVNRLGLTSVGMSCGNGTRIRGDARFDRVLVDAPCTCEGTTRKTRPRTPDPAPDWHKMAALQKGLLRRAVELTRPGGVIVYSTCTYAPEENEGVLSAVDPARVCIEPIRDQTALRAEPGLPAWNGTRYRPDVAHAARVWPHHNDTGGFFVARLRRL